MTVGAISNSWGVYGYSGANSYMTNARTQAAGAEAAGKAGLPADRMNPADPDGKEKVSPNPDENVKPGKRVAPADCQTCKERKYQDGSDESNVSFKAAAHVSPNAAGAAVRAHEGQHVKNAYTKAAKGNGKVLSATVSIHTAVCPECGRTYVSGGTTKTAIKYSNESNPYQKNRKSLDAARLIGSSFDAAV